MSGAWCVVALETKRNAVGRSTSDEQRWWLLYITRAEACGRARAIPGSASLIGCDWEIDCDDRDHADWVADLLCSKAGFLPVMLRVKSTTGRSAYRAADGRVWGVRTVNPLVNDDAAVASRAPGALDSCP